MTLNKLPLLSYGINITVGEIQKYAHKKANFDNRKDYQSLPLSLSGGANTPKGELISISKTFGLLIYF